MKLKQAVHVMRILTAAEIPATIGVDGPEEDKHSYVVKVTDPTSGDMHTLSTLEQIGAHIVAVTRAGADVLDPSVTPAMVDPELRPS